jgi:hypothetical protein
VAGSCENVNKLSVSIKGGISLGYLSDLAPQEGFYSMVLVSLFII